MINLIITEITPYLIPTATAIVAWLSKDKILHALNVKEKRISIEDARMNTLQSNLDYYQDMVEDLGQKYKDRLGDLEAELDKFKDLSKRMGQIIEDQKIFLAKHEATIRRYENKYGKLYTK